MLVSQIKQYDSVILKDGRLGAVVEVLDSEQGVYLVDVGSSPKDWETIDATIEDIERLYKE